MKLPRGSTRRTIPLHCLKHEPPAVKVNLRRMKLIVIFPSVILPLATFFKLGNPLPDLDSIAFALER
jgi:hypothetical protein